MHSTTSGSPTSEFRFTLRGLMLLVVFAALGSMLVRYDLSRWHDGLLVIVVAWFLVGIGNQIFDLLRASIRAENSSWNVRGTIFIELLRRILLSLVFLGYLTWIVLRSPAVASDEILRRLSWLEWGMPESLFLLALMSGMLLCAPPRDIVPSGPARILRNVALAIGGSVWLFYLFRDRLLIYELVQRTVRGVWSGLRFIDVGMTGTVHDMWVRDCTLSAIIAIVALALAVFLTTLLIRRWNGGWSRELLWLLPLGFSLGVAGWETYWAASTGLPHVEFYWFYTGEAESLPAAIRLFAGGVVLLLFVTEAAFRVGQIMDSRADQGFLWRLRPRSYAHERTAMLVLLGVAVAGWLVTEIFWRGAENYLVELRPTVWRTLEASLPRLLVDSATILKVACVLVTLHCLWSRRNLSLFIGNARSAPILLPKFCVVWTSVLATAVLAMTSLLWLYYTICLMPR